MSTSKLNIIFLFFILICVHSTVQGQSLLNKKVTLSIVNKKFATALKLIQDNTKINLCYNSDIIPKDKIVTIKVENNRLDKVLVPLLASVDLQMKEVNNQIIITKSAPPVIEKIRPEPLDQPKIEIAGRLISILDTVIHTKHDTIVKVVYDTIRIAIYDTKLIRFQARASANRWSPSFYTTFKSSLMYEIQKDARLSESEYFSFFNKYSAVEKGKRGYSLSGAVSVKNKRMELTLGIEYLNLTSEIHLNDLPQTQSKINQTVTSVRITSHGIQYEYKYDTVYLDINYHPEQTIMFNKYSYYGFPVMLTYKAINNKNWGIGLTSGIIYSRLIKKQGIDATLTDGNSLLKNGKGESVSFENASYMVGFEVERPLSQRLFLISTFQYRKSLTSIYNRHFTISEKPGYIYPSISVKYLL